MPDFLDDMLLVICISALIGGPLALVSLCARASYRRHLERTHTLHAQLWDRPHGYGP